MSIKIFLTLAILFFSNCGIEEFVRKNVQKPKVKFSGVKIDRLSFQSIDLLFALEVSNPNPAGIHLNEFEYDLSLNGNRFLQGKQDRGLEIKALSTDLIQIPLSLDYTDIYDTFSSLKTQDSTDYEIGMVLSFYVQAAGIPVRIPVKKQGKLPLIKPPKINVASLQLKNIGLTGADLALNIQLSNPNAFGFNLEALRYEFAVNDAPWLNVSSQDRVEIPARDDGSITFPISLNFLQVGRSVYELIQDNRPLAYRFKGDLSVTSAIPILGKVNLPFDHSGEITLKR